MLQPGLLSMRPLVEITFTLYEDGKTIGFQSQDFRGVPHPEDVEKILMAAIRSTRTQTAVERALDQTLPAQPALLPPVYEKEDARP